jgi:RHS repeat-associated protein
MTIAPASRYDVHSDAATGLDWMRVRAYNPTTGRFLSRDPLGRAPLFFADAPYGYAGNNPLSNVDPSGQKVAGASSSQVKRAATRQAQSRVQTTSGTPHHAPPPGPCGSSNVKYCWAHQYDGGEIRDGALLLGMGLAGFAGFIASFIGTDGGVTWLLTLFTHSFLSTILHDISSGIEKMIEGITGPLTAATRVIFDIANLIVDVVVMIYDTITIAQGISQLLEQATSWSKMFMKLGNLIQHNLNQKFFAALVGDLANGFWNLSYIVNDYDNLRLDARNAGYDWILP